ncbi:MAG TPA: plastocyanin/azurin family copper-binding protein [Candidatus Tumulicola sp.]|nr:plastocyanin/azurin family copper-binding protein [Candidatus Tumulicola sp.]
MRRTLPLVLAFALAACAGTGSGTHAVPAFPNPAFQSADRGGASMDWPVMAGGAADQYALQALDFYPNVITIDAGDTITYQIAGGTGGDAHTVSFVPAKMKMPSPLDPLDLVPRGGTIITGKKFVNSGILVGGQTFTLSFPKPGTYRIVCLFHEPAMEGTVVVQKAGTHYPHGVKYYQRIGESQQRNDLGAARASVALFPFKPGGTMLAAGIAPGLVQYPPSDATVLRYVDTTDASQLQTSGNLTIKVGTVVTWVNETANEPHTITLNVAGQKKLPNIPPDPPVNFKRHGITDYDGSQVVNSGTFLGGTAVRLRFTKAGKFFYGCLYHDNSGMDGTITVTK